MDRDFLEYIRHEFVWLHGLYASDLEDFSESFQLDFKDVIDRIDKELDML